MTNRTDTFVRADNVTSMNSPSDGLGDYTVESPGVCGITGNKGYFSTSGSQLMCYLETNVSDLTLSVGVAAIGADNGVLVRGSDTTHYLLGAWSNGVGWRVFEDNGGSFTQKGSTAAGTPNAGDVLSLQANGTGTNGIVLSSGGSAKVTTTSSFNSTSTLAGLRSHNDTTVRWGGNSPTSDLTATAIAAGAARQSNLLTLAVT